MSPFTLKDLSDKVSGLYSEEHKRYLKGFGKCPLCEVRGTAQLVDAEGKSVVGKLDWKLSIKPDPDRPVLARCKHCEETWPIFADTTDALPAPEPTVEIVETEQTVERLRVGQKREGLANGPTTLCGTEQIEQWLKVVRIDAPPRLCLCFGTFRIAPLLVMGHQSAVHLRHRVSRPSPL